MTIAHDKISKILGSTVVSMSGRPRFGPSGANRIASEAQKAKAIANRADPKTIRKRGGRANELTRAVLDLLAARNIIAWRNATTGVYDPASKRFRTFTGRKGVSDIIGVLPGGRALFIEIKTGRDKLSIEQSKFLCEVGEHGALAGVARDLDDVINLIGGTEAKS